MHDEDASNVGGIMSTNLAASFRSTLSDIMQNNVISHFLAD